MCSVKGFNKIVLMIGWKGIFRKCICPSTMIGRVCFFFFINLLRGWFKKFSIWHRDEARITKYPFTWFAAMSETNNFDIFEVLTDWIEILWRISSLRSWQKNNGPLILIVVVHPHTRKWRLGTSKKRHHRWNCHKRSHWGCWYGNILLL